jgi:argininosuccinate lyase
LSTHTAGKISNALIALYRENENNNLTLNVEDEDVHLNIEKMVINLIGEDIGGRIHTARSRNDQVVTDTRLYLRQAILDIKELLESFSSSLLELASRNTESLAIGYTHVQPAQPITVAYWYTAYASIFTRDCKRLENTFNSVNQSVLGACALAGTSFNIDRLYSKSLLAFDGLIENALDATSSRDFVIETISSLATIMSNLSKLSEEIVTWNSFEYGLLDIDDSFSTGSSIMPQKKNPVVAELAKGKVGRVYGALIQILTTIKGVSLGYNCDLQEDKPMLWDAIDTVRSTINILHQHVLTSKYNSKRASEMSWKNFTTITELANWLTKEKDIPFRRSHRITGELTNYLMKHGLDLRSHSEVNQFLSKFDIFISKEKLSNLTDPLEVVKKQISVGSTSPKSVLAMIDNLSRQLADTKSFTVSKLENIKICEAKLLQKNF